MEEGKRVGKIDFCHQFLILCGAIGSCSKAYNQSGAKKRVLMGLGFFVPRHIIVVYDVELEILY